MANISNLTFKFRFLLHSLIFAEVTVFKSFEYYIMFSSTIIFYLAREFHSWDLVNSCIMAKFI